MHQSENKLSTFLSSVALRAKAEGTPNFKLNITISKSSK